MRRGGIQRMGGVSLWGHPFGAPSPAGQWNPIYDSFQVDFDRDEFTRLLYGKGYDVCWEKAAFCPNRPPDGLAPKDHDINCTLCEGTGFIYFDPVPTRMLVQTVKLNESFYAYGRWDAGSAMVTALPEFRLNYWDRLTLGNGVARFQELVRRQPEGDDLLKYEPLSIEYVAWVNRSKELVIFTKDEHFALVDGSLHWYEGVVHPDANDYYTVAYSYRPRYIVLDLIHHHRVSTVKDQHLEFPVQAVAKLDFLIRDQSKDASATDVSDPFPRR